jgi:hypothetical protein
LKKESINISTFEAHALVNEYKDMQ